MKKLDQDAVKLYASGFTLRQIATEYATNHHMVKRFLTKQGVVIEKRYRTNVTPESRKRMSVSAIARGSNYNGAPMSEASRLKMRATKLGSKRDLTIYDDLDKLQFLTHYTSKHKVLYDAATVKERDNRRFEFIDLFYNDPQLSAIWDEWKARGECKWWRPSLDHKVPISRGGTFDLDNLHFITWFENRAKANMTETEWLAFKESTGTSSALFLRVNS